MLLSDTYTNCIVWKQKVLIVTILICVQYVLVVEYVYLLLWSRTNSSFEISGTKSKEIFGQDWEHQSQQMAIIYCKMCKELFPFFIAGIRRRCSGRMAAISSNGLSITNKTGDNSSSLVLAIGEKFITNWWVMGLTSTNYQSTTYQL